MKALCLVAHPDDCIIFAYSYIYNHPELDWTIGYLTYTETDFRGAEFKRFWQQRGIPTVFLGYVDDYRDLDSGVISFDTESARNDIVELCEKYDVILTHDANGDYGHLHHRFVHDSVPATVPKITFARPGTGTTYSVPTNAYDLVELPLHWEVIKGFHEREHKNSYKELL